MPITVELPERVSQTEVNFARWAQVLADPTLASLPYRIETDRHGHILMSPPRGNVSPSGECVGVRRIGVSASGEMYWRFNYQSHFPLCDLCTYDAFPFGFLASRPPSHWQLTLATDN